MDALEQIRHNLFSTDAEVVEKALDDLGTLNPPGAFELMLPFLQDENPEIRGSAACNLGDIKDEKSIRPLLNTVQNDADKEVRSHAIMALENYHSLEILAILLEQINNEDNTNGARIFIADQLINYEGEAVIQGLIELSAPERGTHVRIAAIDALYTKNDPELKGYWEMLREHETHPYLQEVAELALVELG